MIAPSLGLWWAEALCRALPPRVAVRVAECAADVHWRLSVADRRAVQANLSLVLGTPVAQDATLVREVFRNFGRYLAEFLTIDRVQAPEVVLDGEAHLAAARQGGRGLIALTAHVGNWELGAVLLARRGLPVTVVAQPHGDPRADAMFTRQRRRNGVEVIPVGTQTVARSLEALRRGCVLGVLGDTLFWGAGVAVRFCGRVITLPRGPASLSLRSGAPIVPTFLTREGPWRFRLRFGHPLWPQRQGPVEGAIARLVEAYAGAIEREVKRCPVQWVVFRPLSAAG